MNPYRFQQESIIYMNLVWLSDLPITIKLLDHCVLFYVLYTIFIS